MRSQSDLQWYESLHWIRRTREKTGKPWAQTRGHERTRTRTTHSPAVCRSTRAHVLTHVLGVRRQQRADTGMRGIGKRARRNEIDGGYGVRALNERSSVVFFSPPRAVGLGSVHVCTVRDGARDKSINTGDRAQRKYNTRSAARTRCRTRFYTNVYVFARTYIINRVSCGIHAAVRRWWKTRFVRPRRFIRQSLFRA